MIYAIWILALTIFLAVLFALSRARFTIRRIRQSLEEAMQRLDQRGEFVLMEA